VRRRPPWVGTCQTSRFFSHKTWSPYTSVIICTFTLQWMVLTIGTEAALHFTVYLSNLNFSFCWRPVAPVRYRCFLWNELILTTNQLIQSVTNIKGVALLTKIMETPCREPVSCVGTCVTTPELAAQNGTPVHIAVIRNLCGQTTCGSPWVPQSDTFQLFDVIDSSWGFVEFTWWSVAFWTVTRL
jgi:hypothetical protein